MRWKVRCSRPRQGRHARPTALLSVLRLAAWLTCQHQIHRLRALAFLVGLDLEGDALSFGEVLQSGALHRGDVDEHVAAAVIRLDEAVAALAIETFPCPGHRLRAHSSTRIAP